MHVGGPDTKVMFRAVCMTSWKSRENRGFWATKVVAGYVKNGPDMVINSGLQGSSGPKYLLKGELVGHPICFSTIRSLA